VPFFLSFWLMGGCHVLDRTPGYGSPAESGH